MPVLRDRVLAYFQTESPHPLKLRDLAKALDVSDEDYGDLRRLMRQLEHEGTVVRLRNNRYGPPDRMSLAVGRLSVNPGGFGFVSRETGGEDAFIGAQDMGTALHGDRVVVRLYGHRGPRRQQEGQVIRVLERSLKTVVGVYRQDRRFGYVAPDDKRITRDIYVAPEDALGAAPGQKVVVKIEAWASEHLNPEGRVVEVLGDPGAPGMDILSIIKEYELPLAFPDHILKQANAFSETLSDGDLQGRLDLRETICFTIDPDDAKDFDDAVSLDPQEDGTFLLGVHIADVSHYVREGAPLDHEARVRGTSVYLVDRVIPMLPERLSNVLCSLRPGEDRLTMSVLARLDAGGDLLDYRITESVIRSAARLTYEQAQAVLEGDFNRDKQDGQDEGKLQIENYKLQIAHSENPAREHRDRLLAMEALRRRLTARRIARGALDFDLPEAKVILDAKGVPLDVRRYERLNSHRLIEEFMLLANEIVARHAHDRGVPILYRVHDRPDRAKLEAFAEMVESFGYRFSAKDVVSPIQITRFLESIQGKRAAGVINEMLLRSMKKALYTPDNIGHFGLACAYYAHFTSPIRRYPDLIVHRILREALRGEMTEHRQEALRERLPEVGDLATEREVIAEDADRESVKVKQVQFMEGRVGDEFDGLIVSVRPMGMFVQVGDYLIDGLVRVSTIEDDYYIFEERMHALIGERTGRTFRLGDRVRIQVVRADRALRQIDLLLVGSEGEETRDEGREARGGKGRSGRARRGRPAKSYGRREAVRGGKRY